MKIDIDPQGELLKWGPIDGKLIYPDFFNVAFIENAKVLHGWPDVLWLGLKDKIIAIIDYPELRSVGQKDFNKFILNDNNFNKYYKSWHKNVQRLLEFQKGITLQTLKKLTGAKLAEIYKTWAKIYLNFWTIGLLPETGGWGGEDILKKELEKSIPSRDFIFVFEQLSAPEDLSFYQKAELDLLKLRKFLKNKELFSEKLDEYHQNHFWILNSYHHTKVLGKNHFRKELLSYSLSETARRIKEVESLPKKVKQEKRKIIKKYKLNRKIGKIAARLGFCIWWQDLRKYYIFLANHYIDVFLREFSERFKVNFNDLHYYNFYEILRLVEKNKKVPVQEIKKRCNNVTVYYSKKSNSLKYISGSKAKKISDQYLEVKVDKKTKQFKGIVVSSGKKVKALVKIITTPRNINKMKKGDILVAAMTSPDYILAMKKASAIITDEGGMTCHAAIVSRELGIPCIVNTKIATRVLKDGDLVEVDTKKGVINIFKSRE